ITYLPNEISLKLTFVLQIVANLLGSLLIDHFGWTNMPVSRVNIVKLIGIVVAAVGTVLAVVSQIKDNPPDASPGLTFVYILLALISGFILPFQTTVNIMMCSEKGPLSTSILAFTYSYFFSVPLTFIMSIIYALASPGSFYDFSSNA